MVGASKKKYMHGWYSDNKEHHAAYMKAYAEKNRDAIKARRAVWYQENKLARRLSKYGITPEDYNALLEKQDFACAICGTEPWTQRDGCLFVDHDHETGAVRALLCHHCNVGLGHFQEDPELLRKAAGYLEKFSLDKVW